MIAPVTPFQQNCSIVWCDETMEGTAVDPGGDFDMLKQAIDQQGIKVTKVLLTHGHIDHASAAGTMAEHYGVKIEGPHEDDLFLIEEPAGVGEEVQFSGLQAVRARPAGRRTARPSASATSPSTWCIAPAIRRATSCSTNKSEKVAFVGDVLFPGSIGRTDFPRGNHEQLLTSIPKRLWPLATTSPSSPATARPRPSAGNARPTPTSPTSISTTTILLQIVIPCDPSAGLWSHSRPHPPSSRVPQRRRARHGGVFMVPFGEVTPMRWGKRVLRKSGIIDDLCFQRRRNPEDVRHHGGDRNCCCFDGLPFAG